MENKWKGISSKLMAKAITLDEIEDIDFTTQMYRLVFNLVSEVKDEITAAKYLLRDNFDSDIFNRPLLWLERESSSVIEGSMTLFEDQGNNYINDIDNAYSWEDHNLYKIYTKYLLSDKFNIKTQWSKYLISNIHQELYNDLTNNDHFKLVDFNPEAIISKKEPGIIQTSDDVILQHGVAGTKPNIYFIKSSEKEKLLDNLMNRLKNKLNSEGQENPLLLSDISKFHVIFEAIHPFKDGNGRVGRVLMAMLMKIWRPFPEKVHIMNLSEYLKDKKEKYHNLLREVQLDPTSKDKWFNWNFFFIEAMLWTKKRQVYRIKQIAKLYHQIIANPKITSSPERRYFLKAYFKHYKLNRNIEIQKFKNSKSEKALYNDFNLVTEIIGAQETEKGTFDFVKLREILRNKKTSAW